ncbi:hypothetical protein [Nostoc sp. ChiVER01]|uniref:hypothetical protein n=1 Tax=Nostoc sp. ChiVER01 TaxID=3075382 RepID=UPI002AD41F1A|nr:hypothetical protein [Nostoc sp. ChiVER01]MDZ8223207.1 hypothetical protein [Nostoc sp. ChiVER01]
MSNSYLTWLFEFINSTFYSPVDVFKQALKFALRCGNLEFADIAITWAFVRGKWVGKA